MQKQDLLVSRLKTAMEKERWAKISFAQGNTNLCLVVWSWFHRSRLRLRRCRRGRGRLQKLHRRMNASSRPANDRAQHPRSIYGNRRAALLKNAYKDCLATNQTLCCTAVLRCCLSSFAVTWQLPARRGADGRLVRHVSHKPAEDGPNIMDMSLRSRPSKACKLIRVEPHAAITQAIKTSFTLLRFRETGTTSLQSHYSHSPCIVVRSWVRFEHHLIAGLAVLPPLEQSLGVLHIAIQYGHPSLRSFNDVCRTSSRQGFEHHLIGGSPLEKSCMSSRGVLADQIQRLKHSHSLSSITT